MMDLKFKIIDEDYSVKVQKLLVSIGCTWSDFDRSIKHTSAPYLFVSGNTMSWTKSKEIFDEDTGIEFSLEDLERLWIVKYYN